MDSMKFKRGETLRLTAPENAVELRVAGEGRSIDPVSVVDGYAVVPVAVSETMPAGDYMTEWKVMQDDGSVRLPSGPRLTIMPSIEHDNLTHVPKSQYRQILEAAKATLMSAASSAELSFSVGDSNYSFESRNELLTFVNRLEATVASERRRKPREMVWQL